MLFKHLTELKAFNNASVNVFAIGSAITGTVTCGAIELHDCSFSGALTVTCSSLKIDAATWLAAQVAGVTFSVSGATTYLWHGQILSWGASTATTGQFMVRGARVSGVSSAAEDVTLVFAGRPGIVRNFTAFASGSLTATVRKNSANTSLAASPSGSVATDSTHSFSVVATDTLSVAITGTGGGNALATFEFL